MAEETQEVIEARLRIEKEMVSSIRVLALDLERTLIDDALSVQPRPGLKDFLTFCFARFERVALFTTVEDDDARQVMERLNDRGYLLSGFLARLEYVKWTGEYKDLTFVENVDPSEVLLVDDDAGWIRPNQRDRWLAISAWDGGSDNELQRVQRVLETYLRTLYTS